MSEVQTKPIGYYQGILDMYYAIITKPGTATSAPTYGTPAVMGHSMEVKVTPRYREGKVNASNVVQRYVKKVDGYDVSVKVDQLMEGVRDLLLGHKVDANGVGGTTGDDDAPEVAIGFALPLDDGTQELWWIVRGKFAEIALDTKTQEDGSIEYQHPTLEGRFDRRMPDNRLTWVVNTAKLTGEKKTIAEKWFESVYTGAAV